MIMEYNCIRVLSNYIYEKFNLKCINFKRYDIIHNILIFVMSFLIIFDNNLFHLSIILLIISLDAFSIVVLHNCPLTMLEKKYLKKTSCEERNKILKGLGIMHKCNHQYENQIELLINVWMLVTGKCLLIILLKLFNIRLTDFSKLYI